MKKWNSVVVVTFCVVVALLVSHSLSKDTRPQDPRLQAATQKLALARIEQRLKNIKIYAAVKFYGITGFLLTVCSGGFILALSFYRKNNVHEQQIGESIIRVKYRDLSKLVPVCVQLAECEQLKASSPEHYISELISLMGEHRKYLQAVFPHSLDKIPETHALPAHVPSFHDLLNQGEFAHPGCFVLGTLQDGTLKRVNRSDFISCAFGGESGSGKTSTLRNVVSQVSLHGDMQVFILDPQEGHPDSLSNSLGALTALPSVTVLKRLEIKQGVSELLKMVEQRKTGQEPHDKIILIIFDEVGDLIRGCPEAKRLIDEVGSRTRKYNVYGLFATQSWPAKMFDGSEVRDNLVLTMAHKMKRRQAQTLFDDNHIAKRVSHLRQGQLIGRGQSFDDTEIINVPYCSPADAEDVFRLCQRQLPVNQPIDTPSITVSPQYKEDPIKIDTIESLRGMLANTTITQKQVSEATNIDRGLLSNILKGNRQMSANVEHKIQTFLENNS